jgi:hypothetical protein
VLSSNAALQMATSLGRLQASSVDLVYLHSPDPTTHIADTMRVMDALHRTVRGSRLLALIQQNYKIITVMLLPQLIIITTDSKLKVTS